MAAFPTALNLLNQHPTNSVDYVQHKTGTQNNKAWAPGYHPISNLVVHTSISPGGVVHANYDAFLPPDPLDNLRLSAGALAPNERKWSIFTVADRELWFHAEISNIVLAAWNHYPTVTQASHHRPEGLNNLTDEVAAVYSMQRGTAKAVLAVGEIRRIQIDTDVWQKGTLSSDATQQNLSRELRGHASKFECPQVFYFDGSSLLLLQFRAESVKDLKAIDCQVDCWVLPMQGCFATWRLALYKLLAQGFRRIQGACAIPIEVGGLRPLRRRFFNGQPVWEAAEGGREVFEHPGGYCSGVDTASGMVVWYQPGGYELVGETDMPFWTK